MYTYTSVTHTFFAECLQGALKVLIEVKMRLLQSSFDCYSSLDADDMCARAGECTLLPCLTPAC